MAIYADPMAGINAMNNSVRSRNRGYEEAGRLDAIRQAHAFDQAHRFGEAKLARENALADILRQGLPDFYAGGPSYVAPQAGGVPEMPPDWFRGGGSSRRVSGRGNSNRLAELLGSLK